MQQGLFPARKEACSRKRSSRFYVVGFVLFAMVLAVSLGSLSSPAPVRAFSRVNGFSLSPTSGPVGTVIAITGTNLDFAAGATLQLGYRASANANTCTLVADSSASAVANNGSYAGWLRWPSGTATGTFSVCTSNGNHTNTLVENIGSFTLLSSSTPALSITPTTPKAGQSVTVAGTNFLPQGTSVTMAWRTSGGQLLYSLKTLTSDATGTISETFTVPTGVVTGSYEITAIVGSGTPATLSATTTFTAQGYTIAATAAATTSSPTAGAAVSTVSTVGTNPTAIATKPVVVKVGATIQTQPDLLPVTLGIGLSLAFLAGCGGILFVRRQKALARIYPANSATGYAFSVGEDWLTPADLSGRLPSGNLPGPGDSVNSGDPMNPGYGSGYAQTSASGSLTGQLPQTQHPVPLSPMPRSSGTLPFDPGLVEAMREAQVSLYATPKPRSGDTVLSKEKFTN